MKAIGSTFGGMMNNEVKRDYYRIRVMINAKNPLKRGVFLETEVQENCWILLNMKVCQLFALAVAEWGIL